MQIREFYDAQAGNYDARHENATVRYMRQRESEILRRYASGATLDVGCGTHSRGTVGIDVSSEMARIAGGAVARAENIPFSDGSFETVISLFSVLNLCDSRSAVKEMHRVLKSGGLAIISVSSVWDKTRKHVLLRKSNEGPVTKNVRIEGKRLSFHLFSKDEIVGIFEQAGFELVDFDGLFVLQQPFWGWYRNFTASERAKLFLDKILPKTGARVYFAVFKKR